MRIDFTPQLQRIPLFAAANLVGGAISGITGLIQRGKANKALRNMQYPTETLPSEYTENQNIARREAATGLPSEQYARAMRDIQRQQLSAIRGAQSRRSGVGLIPLIQQGTNDATLNLNARDAEMKLANERNYMNVNNQVAGVKRDLYDLNTRQKYNRDYDYNMSLLGAGGQNLTGGIDKLATGALGLFGSGGYGGSRSNLSSVNSRIPVPQLGGLSRGSVGSLSLPNQYQDPRELQPRTYRSVQIGG